MSTIETYSAPRTLEEVARILADRPAAVLAGGTDVMLRWSRGLVPRPETVVDLKRVEALRGVCRRDGDVRVGACTLMSEISRDPIILASAPVLAQAADRVACAQIRNRATIGGNLCNASPAADTAVPLILLDATLDIAAAGPGGATMRAVPITDFFKGPGDTVLAAGEVLTHVRFKPQPQGAFADWDKFGTRPAMEIAIASVGVLLGFEGRTVTHARLAYGSVAPTPLRGSRAEAELVGKVLDEGVIGRCVAAAREEVSPITDVRAGAEYRRHILGVMLGRMLSNAARD